MIDPLERIDRFDGLNIAGAVRHDLDVDRPHRGIRQLLDHEMDSRRKSPSLAQLPIAHTTNVTDPADELLVVDLNSLPGNCSAMPSDYLVVNTKGLPPQQPRGSRKKFICMSIFFRSV